MENVSTAINVLNLFIKDKDLKTFIKQTEDLLHGKTAQSATFLPENTMEECLNAAFIVKKFTGQINIIVHYFGILLSLKYILDEDEEIISLSLGAGNTGKEFDLVTNKRLAEFKFIEWKGGPESIRQNNLFFDYYKLLNKSDQRRKIIYLLETNEALKFFNSKRSMISILKNKLEVKVHYDMKYKHLTIGEFYKSNKDRVEIINLLEIVPPIEQAYLNSFI